MSDELTLHDRLTPRDEERIRRERITFDVVTDCGGTADQHNPRRCRLAHCGYFRATRGREHGYGHTPLMALRKLPAA